MRAPQCEAPALTARPPPLLTRCLPLVRSSTHNPPQGVGVHEVLRALADAARANDKAGRAQLGALLLRLFYFEELPPEAAQLLAPLLQVRACRTNVRLQPAAPVVLALAV